MVTITCEIADKINFACQQNDYTVLRDLRIRNDGDNPLNDLSITLSSDPPFIEAKKWQIDRIMPGGENVLSRDLNLDAGYLQGLSEAVNGTVTVCAHNGENLMDEVKKPVEVLAYNEWGGAGYMPELLAAFCTPNDPAIDQVLWSASQILRDAGKPDGIDGYQSGSRERVWLITSAIYLAIANLGISYANPPASFERNGQKIRLPGDILDRRVATCLDTTLLFAASLEQAGLHPIIALPEGHAMVGVWLKQKTLSSVVIDDAETLRKCCQLNDLVLIETTLVTQQPAPKFSAALQYAWDKVVPEHDQRFQAAVDICRARAHRIRPLGIQAEPSATDQPTDADIEQPLELPPPLPGFDEPPQEELPQTPAGRLERWQRKLLDLSARNSLLNHGATQTSLKLLCPDPGLLEDKLAQGKKISIESIPQPRADEQDEEIHRQRTGVKIADAYARDALNNNQVLVDLPKDELSKRLVNTYRKANMALQEGGANTLYLALGFLLWKRSEKDSKPFRAPLILLPVTLERRSVRSGVKMLAHDDEPRFNTTLLEMLRRDFEIEIRGVDGDSPLPTDDHGVDVEGVWNKVRLAVSNTPGCEVIEDVVLGHFSFAKYLMWKDLAERADALRENPVVRHLLDTPRDPYFSDIRFVDKRKLDYDFNPADLLAPLPTDSSQMAAIATAHHGKDFIIIGPPGTGKSQTISNLIAHFLGTGKTVLFVSEKTAALNVVHRRLQEIGLGRFCLELHSNKANKAHVLGQLRSAWEHVNNDAGEWEDKAQQLGELRDRLNRVVERLHQKRPNGLTAHYAIGTKIRDEAMAARVTLFWHEQHDPDQLQTLREAVKNLEVQAKVVGNMQDETFGLVAQGEWSPQWQQELINSAGRLSASVQAFERCCRQLSHLLNIELPEQSWSCLEELSALAQLLRDSYRQQTAYALETNGSQRIEDMEESAKQLRAYAGTRMKLSCNYADGAWRDLDGAQIASDWSEAQASWWPKSWFAKRAVIKAMRRGGAQGKPNPSQDAPLLTEWRRQGNAVDHLGESLSFVQGWNAQATDPQLLDKLKTLGQRARAATAGLVGDAQSLTGLRDNLHKLLNDGNDLLAPDATVGQACQAYLKAWTDLDAAKLDFQNLADSDLRSSLADHSDILQFLIDATSQIIAQQAKLNDWCAWRRRRRESVELGLAPLVEGLEEGRVPPEEVSKTFEAAYCAWWSARVIDEDDVLRFFNNAEHAQLIDDFRRADDNFQRATADYIAAKLSGNLPTQDAVDDPGWRKVRHHIRLQRPSIPVRKLIEDAPDVVTTLTPCLMMSPLSVSQYLPANQALFDVVIFDEASQVTVCDAIGAIARGKQVIVAGDPKQMPPTNFFQRADNDPDGGVDYEGDMESILDELRSAGIPEHTLNLHYRSRRESLIAFSNNRYYGDSLITFPAPVHPERAVRLIHSNGFYARGGARHNQGEAQAVVNEILKRLKADDPAVRDQTLGVVTFNSEQQSLIEDLLDRARKDNPEIEWAFAQDKLEPVFVKNLETVQGDERDVILFSITYGPDQSNHLTMNFGPLNREGGERRLNVAMTRARDEMLVFSTLRSDHINLGRTNARAIRDLKHFLEYATRGAIALGAGAHGPLGDYESPFEIAVAAALSAKGWDLHPQVGVSAYRIDIGVVHPEAPGKYLAGVECDGATYHRAAYARERDKIRQSMLEGLGWKLFRVWSTDWWINKPGALEKLDRQLREHLETSKR